MADRLTFVEATADAPYGEGLDLVCFFGRCTTSATRWARRAAPARAWPRRAAASWSSPSRLREVLPAGGFGAVRRAAHAPFDPVLEARP